LFLPGKIYPVIPLNEQELKIYGIAEDSAYAELDQELRDKGLMIIKTEWPRCGMNFATNLTEKLSIMMFLMNGILIGYEYKVDLPTKDIC